MKCLRKINKKINYIVEDDDEYIKDDDFIVEEAEENEESYNASESPIEKIPDKIKPHKIPKLRKPLKSLKLSTSSSSLLGKKRQNFKKNSSTFPNKKTLKALKSSITLPPSPNTDFNIETPFNVNKNYFYQNLTPNEWTSISNFLETSLSNPSLSQSEISSFFSQYPKLTKGEHNQRKLLQILNEKSQSNKNSFLSSYQLISTYIISVYYIPKPSIFEAYFFPNPNNEIFVLKMLSTCKRTIDIAIFTMTNAKIASVIIKSFKRGVKCRIIADDDQCKIWGSNIYQLAAEGIPVKTDDSVRYHMHHKFAIIDKSVVITGSFNWTSQAVKNNQENVLFIENKELAKKYTNEYERMWKDFESVISKEKAIRIIQEIEEKKKVIELRKQKTKEKKMLLKNKVNENKKEKNEKKKILKRKKDKDVSELNNNNNLNESNKENNTNIKEEFILKEVDNNKDKSDQNSCAIF